MRLEQEVRGDRRFDFVRREAGKTGLRMLADIGVGPTVETALLYPDHVVIRQVVTEAIAFLQQRPEITGLRAEGERRRIAGAGGIGHLVRAVGIEALYC